MTGEFTVAVHGLVFLYHANRVVSSKALAENICTHPVRVRKVMARLSAVGLVHAREGRRESGYYSIEGGGQITLLAILDALGETAVPALWRSGDSDCDCLLSSGMSAVMEDLVRDMNERCREKLAGITIGDLEERLLGRNV
ncbi:MAG: Rrf2 family transcriptional regulator [Clostridiaceae bacterium]|nr:Rrf2 family transcriptional regulator [Clostridiaceae bacterium]